MITYDKDTLFKEFKDAKIKDIELARVQLSKNKKVSEDTLETTVYVNRIQFFKDHIKNKSINPKTYDLLDINFEALLKAYESESPRDYFYMSVFGKTYEQKKYEEELELDNEKLANI
jgi:hypothetical protein